MFYSIVSCVIFLILGIIWSRNDFANLAIKIAFLAMFVWGLVASNAISINL